MDYLLRHPLSHLHARRARRSDDHFAVLRSAEGRVVRERAGIGRWEMGDVLSTDGSRGREQEAGSTKWWPNEAIPSRPQAYHYAAPSSALFFGRSGRSAGLSAGFSAGFSAALSAAFPAAFSAAFSTPLSAPCALRLVESRGSSRT